MKLLFYTIHEIEPISPIQYVGLLLLKMLCGGTSAYRQNKQSEKVNRASEVKFKHCLLYLRCYVWPM